MTMQDRANIFAKEYLSNADLMLLYGMSQSDASKLMCTIRRWCEDKGTLRLNIKGKLAVQDYLEYFRLPPERYVIPNSVTEEN